MKAFVYKNITRTIPIFYFIFLKSIYLWIGKRNGICHFKFNSWSHFQFYWNQLGVVGMVREGTWDIHWVWISALSGSCFYALKVRWMPEQKCHDIVWSCHPEISLVNIVLYVLLLDQDYQCATVMLNLYLYFLW